MNYFTAKIGCNIVRDPDTEDSYTEALYEEELREYTALGFSHVEFSHVVKLDIPAAKRLHALSQKLGIQIWSLHSEHLNDSSRERGILQYRTALRGNRRSSRHQRRGLSSSEYREQGKRL